MQNALVSALVSAVVKFWPQIEPLVLKAMSRLARQVIQNARDGSFPDRWKWAEPVFDGIADEVLKMLPADA